MFEMELINVRQNFIALMRTKKKKKEAMLEGMEWMATESVSKAGQARKNLFQKESITNQVHDWKPQ